MIEEYVKGKPYFCDVCDKIKSYPYLDKNVSCDCLVVGGGIDGAITAYYLTKSGIECLLIDKNRLGFMNTCCATALLEYQLDEHARDLKKFFSRADVAGVYKLGLNALNDIDQIINELGNFCHYSKRDTLIFSTKNKDKKEILEEYNFRKDYGFDVKYIDEENNPFPFLVKSALLSKNGGAEEAEKYYDMLYNYATQMFSDENFEIDYEFCGVFSTTKNNLSIIGRDSQKPNLFYNLGYGANGIVYSIFGGQQIASLIKNEPTSPYLKFFSPERKLP